MPMARIEFKLPEEEIEFKNAQNGSEYKAALREIWNEIRSHRKYDKEIKDCLEVIDDIFKELEIWDE